MIDELKKIRKRFGVPAYDSVKIKTKNGEIGIIKGSEGYLLKVYFEGKEEPDCVDPKEVAYLGLTLKR